MEVFIVNNLRLRQCRFVAELGVLLEGLFQLVVDLLVRHNELFLCHFKGFAKLDGDLLLLLENEFIILHIFFSVSLQVRPELMQV